MALKKLADASLALDPQKAPGYTFRATTAEVAGGKVRVTLACSASPAENTRRPKSDLLAQLFAAAQKSSQFTGDNPFVLQGITPVNCAKD